MFSIHKVSCALAMSLLFINPAGAQRKKTRETDGLVGPVHTVRLEKAHLFEKDGKLSEGPRQLESITMYDAQGNTTELDFYNNDGSLISKTVYKYDAKGDLTEQVTYKADGSLQSKDVFIRDAKGIQTELQYKGDGALAYRLVAILDAAGRMTKLSVYDVNGSLDHSDTFSYDPQRNIWEGSNTMLTVL